MLSAVAAARHPAQASAASRGLVTHVGGLRVHLFNDEHLAKARVMLDVPTAHFLDGFDFGKMAATGGKSGELLAFTPDRRFILKSIHGVEHETLLRLTPALCDQLDRPDKLMCSFVLHFEVRDTSPPGRDLGDDHGGQGKNGGGGGGEKATPHPANGCYFVMNNCLPILPKDGPLQFSYLFDLKGCMDDKAMIESGQKVKQLHAGDGPCCFGCDVPGSVCNTPERQRYMTAKRVARSVRSARPLAFFNPHSWSVGGCLFVVVVHSARAFAIAGLFRAAVGRA